MTRSLVFAFTPVVDAQRTRIHPAHGCSLGLLPLPRVLFGWTASAIDLDQLSNALTGLNTAGRTPSGAEVGTTPPPGVSLPASFPLGDGRSVELLELSTDDGSLRPGLSNHSVTSQRSATFLVRDAWNPKKDGQKKDRASPHCRPDQSSASTGFTREPDTSLCSLNS